MLGMGNKRHCNKESSAYIVCVNLQDHQMKTVEVGRNNSEFVIGSGNSSDLVISNSLVSKKHCVIKNDENGDWILYDLSSWGVFVNKERVPSGASHALCEGDLITLTDPNKHQFYFYTNEPCQKKKKLLVATDVLSDANSSHRNKGRKKKNLKEKKNSSVIVLSSDEDTVNRSIIVVDEVMNGNNAKAVKGGGSNEKEMSSLRSKLEKLMEENLKLKEKNCKAAEQYSKVVKDLKLELQVAESRNKLNNKLNENLKGEMRERLNLLLVEKEEAEVKRVELNVELELMKAKLFAAEQSQKEKEEVIKNDVLLKVKEQISELLENELQCSICNEIIIEATVLDCTHMFCHLCINTWMKKKKECAVCRTEVKELIKPRAMDSFIDKAVQKFSSADLSKHRKQVIEDRRKK